MATLNLHHTFYLLDYQHHADISMSKLIDPRPLSAHGGDSFGVGHYAPFHRYAGSRAVAAMPPPGPLSLEYDAAGTPYVRLSDEPPVRLQFENEPLSDEAAVVIAERELRETPDSTRQALAELRRLLANEPDLRVAAEDDHFLLKFLRPCKFYPESALQRMKRYYEFRATHPQYCAELVPARVRAPFAQAVISLLPRRDAHGRRYMLIDAGERWDYRAVPLTDVFRGIQLALEAAMAEPRTQVSGVVVLFDMKGLSFGHVLQFTPLFAKTMVDFIQDCIPIRLKGVHVINQPYIFNMLFAIFKPFLRDKLRSRIHFHGTKRESLFAHVSPDVLWARHGGSLAAPEVPGELLWQMLSHYEHSFQVANSYGYSATKSGGGK